MGSRITAVALAALASIGASPPAADAAVTTFYTDLATFSAAAGGPLLVQDFQGFAPGTDLSGVPFLPGISTTTNMDRLEAFASAGDVVMFGLGGRGRGDARYDTQFALPYTRVSFELDAFEADPNNPTTAQGPGTLTVFYADATSEVRDITGNLLGDAIFVGLISDTAVTSIRWAEAQEGSGGNEETALDNFRVVAVPEPSTLVLASSTLVGLALHRRRRR